MDYIFNRRRKGKKLTGYLIYLIWLRKCSAKGIGEEELNSMCATLEKIENNLNEAIEEQSTEGNN